MPTNNTMSKKYINLTIIHIFGKSFTTNKEVYPYRLEKNDNSTKTYSAGEGVVLVAGRNLFRDSQYQRLLIVKQLKIVNLFYPFAPLKSLKIVIHLCA